MFSTITSYQFAKKWTVVDDIDLVVERVLCLHKVDRS